MRLDDLIDGVGLDLRVPSIELADLILDSKQVKVNTAFFAYQGKKADSKHYIAEAISRGANVIFSDAALSEAVDVPVIVIPNLSEKISAFADYFFAEPSQHLQAIGITGTNGKTSICHYLATAFRALGNRVGTIGTLGISTEEEAYQYTGMTTPDPIAVQRYLQQFVQAGCTWAMLEVSSHGLDQDRTRAVKWRYGIFTNLTRDHLDYHHSFEHYAQAKQRLFEQLGEGIAIINADDPSAGMMLDACDLITKKILYGQHFSAISQTQAEDFLQADVLEATLAGMLVRITTKTSQAEIWIPLVGDFNLYNALAVIAVLYDQGLAWLEIENIMKVLTPPQGRLQRFDKTGLPTTWVDFAHTPDGLEKILSALKPLVPGKLWVVFGCGGNRDRTKRPHMASIAEAYADTVILTQDNSRQEAPTEIIKEMLAGMHSPHRASIELDRSKAIHYALAHAQPDDWVIIAGRGHEAYLQLNEGTLPFSDITYVTEYFERNGVFK